MFARLVVLIALLVSDCLVLLFFAMILVNCVSSGRCIWFYGTSQ